MERKTLGAHEPSSGGNSDSPDRLLSIIIVSWNSCDCLDKCIESIAGGTDGMDVEIIVVDNNSSDASRQMCERKHPGVKYIELEQNMGFARANNIGIRNSCGRYVILLNPDTVVEPDAIRFLIDFMESTPDAGAAGPRLIQPDGSVQGSARRFPSLRTAFLGRTSLLQRILGGSGAARSEIPCLSHESLEPLEVDWISGACMIVRREVIEIAGLLDERFFMYWEDADWCYQMKKHGWRIFWVPKSRILHLTGQSSQLLRVRTTLAFHKSIFYYFQKNINKNILVSALVLTLISARCILILGKDSLLALRKGPGTSE